MISYLTDIRSQIRDFPGSLSIKIYHPHISPRSSQQAVPVIRSDKSGDVSACRGPGSGGRVAGVAGSLQSGSRDE